MLLTTYEPDCLACGFHYFQADLNVVINEVAGLNQILQDPSKSVYGNLGGNLVVTSGGCRGKIGLPHKFTAVTSQGYGSKLMR